MQPTPDELKKLRKKVMRPIVWSIVTLLIVFAIGVLVLVLIEGVS